MPCGNEEHRTDQKLLDFLFWVYTDNMSAINKPKRETVKFVVYVPETHADIVRETLGKTGAGTVGDYTYCSFSVKGIGRFLPANTAHPAIGKVGELESVVEEQIWTVCYKDDLQRIIDAINQVHPYEEVAYDVYPLMLNPHETTYKS